MTDTVVSTVTIAVISNHPIICLGLQKIFEYRETPRFLVRSYQRMMPDVLPPEYPPDAVILDMETERDALGAINQLREIAPKIKILALSRFEDKERLREVLDYGVDGVILKVQPPQVVLAAIDAVFSLVRGHGVAIRNGAELGDPMKFIPTNTSLGSSAAMWPDTLTEREREVAELVGQGLSNKDIAYRLSISHSTVRHHLTSIFDKVGVPNRQKLLVHAHRIHSTPD